jgi:hypothetical protein
MSKRLTTQAFIERAKLAHGDRYDYSLTVYTSNKEPVQVVCRSHGVFPQIPSNHMKGQGCPTCGGTKKLDTDEFIRRSREVHGDRYDYALVSYTSNNDPVQVICPVHGVFPQRPASHMAGSGCPTCSGTQRLTQSEFLDRAAAVHGNAYDYSQVQYRNNSSHVTIICPVHGEWSQTPGNHLAGKGCPKCSGNSLLTTDEFITKAREVHGDLYDYTETVYERSNKLVTITCPTHGDFKQKPNNHLTGHGCFNCNQLGAPAMTQAEFLSKAQDTHGDLYCYRDSGYTRSRVPTTVHCKKHGPFQQMPEKHLAGHGCPSCAMSGPSKAQTEVSDFLAGYHNVQNEVCLDGSRLRLDILLPERALAVEYHGLIWHSSKMLDDPRKDFKKHKLAESQGIRVIHIYQDEWELRQNIVKRLLLSAVGHLPRIAARKTGLVTVGHGQAREFYTSHHLQGARQTRINLGLQHEGSLVACMSFDMLRSSRHNKDPRHWELVRYASSHSVVGGAGKLLKNFLSLGLCDRVTSYSDNRLFSGAMYSALGFSLTHETAPDYHYTTGRVAFGRQHKSQYQKKYLAEQFPSCDLSKTEWEICEENGLHRIYDCGKKRWDLTLPC